MGVTTMLYSHVCLCVAFIAAASAMSMTYPNHRLMHEAKHIFNGLGSSCISTHCEEQAKDCGTQWSCVKAGACNADCQFFHKKTSESCNLLCELNYGYNSTKYRKLMQCMSDNKCLPHTAKSDGKCLATDKQTIQNLTSLAQIGQNAKQSGKWWIVRGLNCGQDSDWPAGFDYFPCQRDDFQPDPQVPGKWVDHIAYCGGTKNKCATAMLYTVANVTIDTPGVMTHYYTDPPLTPQNEEWRVLSFPHPDWMLYIYCGSTPTGAYAGGSVVARDPIKTAGEIPKWIEVLFRAKAKEFNFDYDTMCISDDSGKQCVD